MKAIHSYLLLVTAFAIGLLAHAASAQTATWNAASGTWRTALNWNPTVDPNGPSFNVIFNNGGSLTLDSARNVGTYNQTGGTFAITNSQFLQLSSAGALDGGGVITLSNLNTTIIQGTAGNVVFTNSTGTIRGNGQIGVNGLSLQNQANGIIQADDPGLALFLNGSGSFTNNGLMRAQNGGILVFSGPTDVINNATIRSENSSDVNIQTRIVGGTLDNTGSSGALTLNSGSSAILRDVTIAAGSTVNNNGSGQLENTLINRGTLAVVNSQSIFVASDTTLSGGGVITFANTNCVITNTGSNRTLTNSDNLLRGTGQIGGQIGGGGSLSVINGANGIIQADVSGQTLFLDGSGSFTNNGLIRAQNGGILSFSGSGTFTNNGGTLQALEGTTISGVDGLTFIQTSGTIDLAGGNMNFPSGVDLNGGQLIGNGTFTGPIRNNGGIVGPGHSPGIIAVNGNYTQGTNGTLNIEIGGATAGTGYDQLQVSGTAALGGTLNLSLINGFRPAVGDVFPFILPSAFTGSFSTINTTGFTGQVNYSADAITITVLTVSGTPSPTPTPQTTPSKLLNISTRMRVQAGDNALIGGFIITGTDPQRVIIRGIGPSLSVFFSGTLADPTLELYQGNTLLVMNDNWKTDQRTEIEATGIPPTNDLESAIVRTLTPGSYTAVLRGKNNTTGIGVVEAYDLDLAANSRLANISTRGFVETGDNVMIGGLIIGPANGASATVVVRAIGPSLSNFGVSGALQDPTLDLVNSDGVVIRANNDWRDSQEGQIIAAALAPSDDRESALIETLAPGSYTAIVHGVGNTTGVGLVEAYHLQ